METDKKEDLPIQVVRFKLIKNSVLDNNQKWFLAVVNDYQGKNEWARPLQKTLAADCGYADPKNRQVQRLVDGLRKLGVLIHEPGDGVPSSNR